MHLGLRPDLLGETERQLVAADRVVPVLASRIDVAAEAVMLNKGPFIVDAIRTLDDILGRMRGHQAKKRSLLRVLSVSASLWD